MANQPLTPMMEQWRKAKLAHPDAILLFRMGDFYELFDNDAIVASKILELTLTSRDKDKSGMKMAGFPFHASESYIEKLVEHGFKVAVCEQLEDPKLKKGVVKRGITQVITPGTALIGESSEHHTPAYLMAIGCVDEVTALTVLDVQSSTFLVSSSFYKEEIASEMARFSPREIVVVESDETSLSLALAYAAKNPVRLEKRCKQRPAPIKDQENISLNRAELFTTSLILNYVNDLKGTSLAHIGLPRRYAINEQLLMDESSRNNLDLVPKKNGDRYNLFSLLNIVKTIVGRRALFNRLMAPSTSIDIINERLDSVLEMLKAKDARTHMRDELGKFFDLEKLVALASLGRITPRGVAQIRDCLAVVHNLEGRYCRDELPWLKKIFTSFPDYFACKQILDASLVDAPPINIKDGGVFKAGFDQELDETVNLIKNGKEMLLALEMSEREATRISSLKIKYTRVFGYYIEITKTHLDKVPKHYQRKQTIANGERFVTPELIVLEGRLNGALEIALRIEEEHFAKLLRLINDTAKILLTIAKGIANIDITCSFAEHAHTRSWVRPMLLPAPACKLDLIAARHPLVEEKALLEGHYFVPNDVSLNSDEQRILLITGPNMAGKSTIMRTVLLVQIMAQIGCFVPATSATLSICDAVFARVGASDDPRQGRSTFMVEMVEAAAILSNATAHSLIILDEIGRGTSTYDGMSIAQSVCEYLHDQVRARTLFATHYHELTKLEQHLSRLKNFHVGVEEREERIQFLYSLQKGACLKSFGIEVARLSGLPLSILDRARVILHGLERSVLAMVPEQNISKDDSDVTKKILDTDVNRLTPLQALNKISTWQSLLRKGSKSKEFQEVLF